MIGSNRLVQRLNNHNPSRFDTFYSGFRAAFLFGLVDVYRVLGGIRITDLRAVRVYLREASYADLGWCLKVLRVNWSAHTIRPHAVPSPYQGSARHGGFIV